MKRRNVLAALGALATAGCTKIGKTEWFGGQVDGAEKLSRSAHRALGGGQEMAREFDVDDISPFFRGNGNTGIRSSASPSARRSPVTTASRGGARSVSGPARSSRRSSTWRV